MLSDVQNENKERDFSNHRTSTVAVIVASKKRCFGGTPKKTIALLREPNLFASIGNLVDPYTNKPQQMVILGATSRKATRSTGKTRSPPRSIGLSAPRPSVDPVIPNVDLPMYNEPFREPHRSSHTRLKQASTESLLNQLQRNETDNDSCESIRRRKQLKVYHKIPKREQPQPTSLRRSPGKAVVDLAIDMITEFELLMTQIGIGPVCVPQEKKSRNATTDAGRATKRERPPPLEDDLTDVDTLNASDCSMVQRSTRHIPLHTLRQPSHLSYTTILSGEVEVEMEESFDNTYDYRDDGTYEDRSDTESYEDDDEEEEEDDDSTSGSSESVDRQSTNVSPTSRDNVDYPNFALSIQSVFGGPWYSSSQTQYTSDEVQCSQRSKVSLPSSQDGTTRISEPDTVTKTLVSNYQPISGSSGNMTVDGDIKRPGEIVTSLEHKFVSSAHEKEKHWVTSILDPLLTHLFHCNSKLDDPRDSTSSSLRLAAGHSSGPGHNPVGSTAREACNDCFNDNRSASKENAIHVASNNAQFMSSNSGNTHNIQAPCPEATHPREATSVRTPQWEKLLAALSTDPMDDPTQRHVTFSPSVVSSRVKTESTDSASRNGFDFPEKTMPARQRGRGWQRRMFFSSSRKYEV